MILIIKIDNYNSEFCCINASSMLCTIVEFKSYFSLIKFSSLIKEWESTNLVALIRSSLFMKTVILSTSLCELHPLIEVGAS